MSKPPIEHGFNSPLWMSRQIIWGAHHIHLRRAVENLMNYLWTSDKVDVEDAFDILVQVAATGKYHALEVTQEEYEDTMRVADDLLKQSEDLEVDKFREVIDKWDGSGES